MGNGNGTEITEMRTDAHLILDCNTDGSDDLGAISHGLSRILQDKMWDRS